MNAVFFLSLLENVLEFFCESQPLFQHPVLLFFPLDAPPALVELDLCLGVIAYSMIERIDLENIRFVTQFSGLLII